MEIDILTLFPGMFPGYLDESILKRAQAAGLLDVRVHDIRAHATDRHRKTDDVPFGGGGGMVLKPEPVFAAIEALAPEPATPVILLTPQGRTFHQATAVELARRPRLILLCGRYEGVDERIRRHLVTDEISIGDYVLTGGELAALVVVDAVARLLPGALGDAAAPGDDSFATGLLEGPHYTRPAVFRDWPVPEVLRSGHAANIAAWRRRAALRRTWRRRPDLLDRVALDDADRAYLARLAAGEDEAHDF